MLFLSFVGSTINEHLATIIVGSVQLVSNIASLFMVDRAGRKPLLLASAVIMCMAMASMGTAFYLNENGMNTFGCVQAKRTNGMPRKTFLIDVQFLHQIFAAGQFDCLYDWILDWIRMHSIFAAGRNISSRSSKHSQFDCRLIQSWRNVHRNQNLSLFGKGMHTGIYKLCGNMIRMITNSLDVLQLITTAGTFWMYSVFCAIAAIFVVMVVPETKGRDLDSIAKLFVKNSSDASQTVSAIKTADGKTNVHLTTVELHVPVSVATSNATPSIETHKSHANLEITRM